MDRKANLKNQLVIETKSALGEYTDRLFANVQDFEIEVDGKIVRLHLTDEIDVLALIGNVLVIVECKDISLRHSAAGFRTDFSKVKKFESKMQRKILELTNKLDILQQVFGQDISHIESVMVFRNPNIAMLVHDIRSPKLISLNELRHWLNEEFGGN